MDPLKPFEWMYSLLPTLFKWYHHVCTKPMGILNGLKWSISRRVNKGNYQCSNKNKEISKLLIIPVKKGSSSD